MPKYKAWAKANPLCYVSLLAMMRERLYQTTDRNTDIADFARFRDEVRAQLAKVREQGRQRRKRKRKPDNTSSLIVNREDIAAEKIRHLIRSAGVNEDSLKTCLDFPSYDTEFFLRLAEKLGLDISAAASEKRAKVLKALITKILENN